ncbi:FCD domain-containing protein [Paracoccus caeni]|uniref:Pyruvate dehydrogenase complex repressor n=1 Tax=Paracoccus caeni TaxID=657651 RepID=A0A934SH17_9RHOB|nr:FCD domain-containing protein [Paracoccus caeni]MBK4217463.1 FCD domain-containing protein [Paracoccus caeni]
MSEFSIKPERTAESVARHIEALILEGSLRPGEALLSERDLALRLNVSRPTVRDGLKLLEERGLLTGERGKGARVAQMGQQALTDPLLALLADKPELTDHYLEFRDVVESRAAALAAERGTEIDMQAIRDCRTRIEKAHEAGLAEDEAAADADLHIAIYEASHNLVLLQIMRALASGLRSDIARNRSRIFAVREIRETLRDQHLSIAQAILDRDPVAAESASHAHLSFVRQSERELREMERQTDLSLRRQESGGIGQG